MTEPLTVLVDPAITPQEKQKELISNTCLEINVRCDFVPQRCERTISWMPPLSASSSVYEDITKEIMAVLNAEEAVQMIQAYIQSKHGDAQHMTLTQWVSSLQASLPGHNITVFIVGLTKYFSNQKLKNKRNFKEAATGQATKRKKKNERLDESISFQQADEAFVELQLFTGCVVQQTATFEEFVGQLKYFTKSVREKPAKKDRFDSVLSFLDEATSGIYVNKQGQGLSKVWKHQLMQYKNFGSEMAEAVAAVYPSPYLLHKACKEKNNKEAEAMIADINVRRNASVISTNRKIGKEQARRIYTFMTSKDPDQVIK
uniref:Uncharacterized protein n=1 Tax=Biomphalaria glabrata TaxID=6526 RepID=A0A2C9LP38_BIOGL